MKIHILQHVDFEEPGAILDWTSKHGHAVSYTQLYLGEALPSPTDIDMLVVMGGPMNVNEEEQYPWLKAEKQFIRDCVAADKAVLGICLGSQLIAAAMGAKVYPNKEKEIGFLALQKTDNTHPVSQLFSDEFTCFQWHGDTFDLPVGATHLITSEACANQAFIIGDKVLALQFHAEGTPHSINRMLEHEDGELAEGGKYVHSSETIQAGFAQCAATNKLMFELLDYLAARH